jgi:hypothetical protein
MKWLLVLILIKPSLTMACLPNEIHIREQWIDTYTKEDGTHVSAHVRSEHCREVKGHNYFQDSSSKEFRNFNSKFKSWSSSEKNLLNSQLEKLPPWIKKYKIANFLRASVHEGNLSPKPPHKVIIPDSSHSPSEDFANSVEIYYSNPKRLKEFNPKSFAILEGIIKSKEKR